MKWYNISDERFSVEGFAVKEYENEKLYRLPEKFKNINEEISSLAEYSSGCRIRFKTNSRTVRVKVKLSRGKNPDSSVIKKLSPVLVSGMDMYSAAGQEEYSFRWITTAPSLFEEEYTADLHKFNSEIEDVLINLPVFNGVKRVELGFADNAEVFVPREYKIKRPIVFYGSSITQGACASRPGCTYLSIVSRWLDAPYINLGFAGSAKGEPEIAQYIAGLEMSAFVFDYDHNAPTPEHLENTHKRFYDIVREKNPSLPIIILSRPVMHGNDDSEKRMHIINDTYEDALLAGDRNVWFIDGSTLWEYFDKNEKTSATLDTCHPNDYGFMSMAKIVYPILRKALTEG